MAFNEQLPQWENEGTQPPQSKRVEGWLPNEKPPASWFNWLFGRTYKVLQELQSKAETKTGAQAKADASAAAALSAANNYTDQEIVALAGEGNDTTVKNLDDRFKSHKADDVSQGNIPHTGLGGSISHLTNTGEVSTPHKRQVNASRNSIASGDLSQVNASRDSTASGDRSQVNASYNSTASGIRSQVNASRNSIASGDLSQVNASSNSTASRHGVVIGSAYCGASGGTTDINSGSILLSAWNTVNNSQRSIASGFSTTDIYTRLLSDGRIGTEVTTELSVAESWPEGYTRGAASNKTLHINTQHGSIQHSGTISTGHNFTDLAEIFPNLTGEEQGYGLLQTIDGFGVRPAQENERVIGVTSATAGVILGDTPFSWQGRWLKDEWGSYIYETIISEGEEIEVPKENPDWNPELEQKTRQDRPEEWSVVGLVGQVYVRLKEDVQPMDYVKAWQNGIGQKSLEPTNLQVMKITQEYDAEKGYKIGFCLLR